MSDKHNDKKPSLIEIKNRRPGVISHGANTAVYVDGQRLRCVKKVELTIEAGKPAELRMEFSSGRCAWRMPAAKPDPMPPHFGPWPTEKEIERHRVLGGIWLARSPRFPLRSGAFYGSKGEEFWPAECQAGHKKHEEDYDWTFCPIDQDGNKVARSVS